MAVEPVAIVQPPLPGPIKLTRVHWRRCGAEACVTMPEAQAQVRNTVAVGRWMSQMNSAVNYYRDVTSTPGTASSK